MELLSKIFPYFKTLAGIKSTLAHVVRFKDPPADAGRRARTRPPSVCSIRELYAVRNNVAHKPVTYGKQKRRGSNLMPFTSKLVGMFGFPVFSGCQKLPTDYCPSSAFPPERLDSETHGACRQALKDTTLQLG